MSERMMTSFRWAGRAAILLSVSLSVAVGCDRAEEASEGDAPKAAAKKAATSVKKEVDRGAKHVIKGGGPKWKVKYSGDLKGSVEGAIMTVQSSPRNTTVLGKAVTKDKRNTAPQSFRAQVLRYGETPSMEVDIKLADGTECKSERGDTSTRIDITDADRKTFAATLKGKLNCGGKTIQYEAQLDNEP